MLIQPYSQAVGEAAKVQKPPEKKEKAQDVASIKKDAYILDIKDMAVSKLESIKAKIRSGYYDRPEIVDAIVSRVMKIL